AAVAQGSYEIARQFAALVILLASILLISYLAFSAWLILPPLVPMIFAFAIAAPLTLSRRAFVLSREIDSRIKELSKAGQSLLAGPLQTVAGGAGVGRGGGGSAGGGVGQVARGGGGQGRGVEGLDTGSVARPP